MLFSGRVPYLCDVRVAADSDLKYILSLHRANADALGWLGTSVFIARIAARVVLIARDNGEPCGYLMTTGVCTYPKITHACIQYDARGRLHGFGLVHRFVRELLPSNPHLLSLRCRDGLPSNLFWSDAGFFVPQVVDGTNAKRLTLNNWHLDLRTLTADSPYNVPGPNEGALTVGAGSSKSRDVLHFPATTPAASQSAWQSPRDAMAAAMQLKHAVAPPIVTPVTAKVDPATKPRKTPATPPPPTPPTPLSARDALQLAMATRHTPRQSVTPATVSEQLMNPAQRDALLKEIAARASRLKR